MSEPSLLERLHDMSDPKRVGSHFHPLYGEAADEIVRLQMTLERAVKLLKQNGGLLCESGNLNNYRNLSDEELGRAWVATATLTAEFLNEIEAPQAGERGK